MCVFRSYFMSTRYVDLHVSFQQEYVNYIHVLVQVIHVLFSDESTAGMFRESHFPYGEIIRYI